jgi:nucleoid-associated protein Lsr2
MSELTVRPLTSTMPTVAQKVVTELTDDTDGKLADETVTFALDGREYEIDLMR